MKNELKKWFDKDAKTFLQEVGVKEGNIVADIGCGYGHYTIPIADMVGKNGKVFAIDKKNDALEQLIRMAEERGLKNIEPMNTEFSFDILNIDMDDEILDSVFLYDILHYFNEDERKQLYGEINRVLKNNAILSVYPKHNKSDWPMWNLANMDLEEIIKEIRERKFNFIGKKFCSLFHDEGYDRGYILSFKKCVDC